MTRGNKVTSKAAVVAALGALLLAGTACESSGADGSDDFKPSDRPSATRSPKAGETASAKPGGGSANTGGEASSSNSAAVVACAEGDLAFSATNEDEEGKSVRHLLLTVTNTGNKRCNVYHYPYLKFAYAREAFAVIKDSEDAPATLAPGEKAYAALLANGGGMDTYDTNTIPLSLQGPDLGSKVSEPINLDLPGRVAFDDGARVTYWTTAPGLALRFIMSS
ncbi:DUF4232 domain-containing protein [Streptomyces sp. NBC_00162]|uniref:DUF4232 domain-containing protein n=1 Tax=Streptomyces sp. NBC_00162 TaxID=2903629 RepID=UPI00214BA8A2|nr:DUF4232 domain-containing protein [Streptomyces sp. NBC_00162]UUU37979.1 DUF4232 domain-containing protein [Streptomyces sp. NBC_00162]